MMFHYHAKMSFNLGSCTRNIKTRMTKRWIEKDTRGRTEPVRTGTKADTIY